MQRVQHCWFSWTVCPYCDEQGEELSVGSSHKSFSYHCTCVYCYTRRCSGCGCCKQLSDSLPDRDMTLLRYSRTFRSRGIRRRRPISSRPLSRNSYRGLDQKYDVKVLTGWAGWWYLPLANYNNNYSRDNNMNKSYRYQYYSCYTIESKHQSSVTGNSCAGRDQRNTSSQGAGSPSAGDCKMNTGAVPLWAAEQEPRASVVFFAIIGSGPPYFMVTITGAIIYVFGRAVFVLYVIHRDLRAPILGVIYKFDHIREDLSYTEEPESILDRQDRVMRNKTISFVKILWRNHPEREATWETEESIRTSYPHFLP
ncbi:hypothetical protein Tco_0680889 [Tanacetum coccineum]|uniref:Chromo domain-containing protein n=1 Tax=Tanacetum coccineum TaxID=301880 RepID=A0ABQ4XNC3_9ASTR